LLAPSPDASFFVVVLRIGGPALPIHLALESSDRLGIRSKLRPQRFQRCLPGARDDGDGGRPKTRSR
jgi:hypothetical protein